MKEIRIKYGSLEFITETDKRSDLSGLMISYEGMVKRVVVKYFKDGTHSVCDNNINLDDHKRISKALEALLKRSKKKCGCDCMICRTSN